MVVRSIIAVAVVLAVSTHATAGGDRTDSNVRIGISALGGASMAHVSATGLMEKYFAPTDEVESVVSAAGGVEFQVLLWRWLGVSVGTRYQKSGQSTRRASVLYADDIFEHDFSSSVEMNYLAVPLCIKAGISVPRGWLLARAGVQPAYLLSDSAVWTIDGVDAQPGSMRMPDVNIDRYDLSLLAGIEAGVSLGNNGVFALVEYAHGVHDIASGVSGRAYNRSAGISAGYRRFF